MKEFFKIGYILANLKSTSLCSATYVRWQRGTARIRSPHAAAAAIDRYLLPNGLTAANLQQRVYRSGPMLGQTDGRTDGWTMYRFIDPAPHTMRAVQNIVTPLKFLNMVHLYM